MLSPGVPFLVGLAVDLKEILLALDVDGEDLPVLLDSDDCNDVQFSRGASKQ